MVPWISVNLCILTILGALTASVGQLFNGYETLYIVYLALIRNMRDEPFPGASDIMTNCKWPTS